jgi:hypothetical protein
MSKGTAKQDVNKMKIIEGIHARMTMKMTVSAINVEAISTVEN